MDPVQRNQALFHKIDQEISLFVDAYAHNKGDATVQMNQLLKTSASIGGGLHRDILQLQKDFQQVPSNKEKVIQDALRIKHEVKEI